MNKTIKFIEKNRVIIGFCLLVLGLYMSYSIFDNYDSILNWLYSLSGADPKNMKPAHEDSWVGLILLTGLCVCLVGLFSSRSK